jgi:hypothetical protein
MSGNDGKDDGDLGTAIGIFLLGALGYAALGVLSGLADRGKPQNTTTPEVPEYTPSPSPRSSSSYSRPSEELFECPNPSCKRMVKKSELYSRSCDYCDPSDLIE